MYSALSNLLYSETINLLNVITFFSKSHLCLYQTYLIILSLALYPCFFIPYHFLKYIKLTFSGSNNLNIFILKFLGVCFCYLLFLLTHVHCALYPHKFWTFILLWGYISYISMGIFSSPALRMPSSIEDLHSLLQLPGIIDDPDLLYINIQCL